MKRFNSYVRSVIFLLIASSTVRADTAPMFQLCVASVQRSEVGELASDGWPVYVELTRGAALSFEAFTEANIGNTIRLIADDREFIRAMISVPIHSGVLRGVFSTQQEATQWQQLLEQLPADPCGIKTGG